MKPKTISEFIAAAPRPARAKLRELRALIAAAAPGAVESLKWSMPAFSYDRILVTFCHFKNHVSLFPTPAAIRAFKKDLVKFKTSAGTIQFPLDQPLPKALPKALIKRIVAFRARDAKSRDAKWRE